MQLIDSMLSDTLWIYTSIIGALLGAAFLAYFRNTRAGLWCYAKFDMFLDWLVERWGLTWFEQPVDAWRKKYPYVTKKIDELEARIKKLEGKKGGKKKRLKKQGIIQHIQTAMAKYLMKNMQCTWSSNVKS